MSGLRAVVAALSVCLLRTLLVLCLGVFDADAMLTNMTLRPHYDLFTRAAHNMLLGKRTVSHSCEMEPGFFEYAVDFYVLTCPMSVRAAELVFNGTDLYDNALDEYKRLDKPVSVEMIEYGKPVIVAVNSCPKGFTPSNTSKCKLFTFDIYRFGGDYATLAVLAVSSSELVTVSPNFHPATVKYSTTVHQGMPFSITASSKEKDTKVGIQSVDKKGKVDTSSKGGLGSQNGCHLASRRHYIWEIPGFSATGEYIYAICAVAADGSHYTNYTLTVTVVPNYSIKLASLVPQVKGAKLNPEFDPTVQSYELAISATTMDVPFAVTAHDSEAKLSFAIGGIPQPTNETCEKDTGGTCRFGSCAKSRGETHCKSGSCLCEKALCASAGRCVKPMFDKVPRGTAMVPIHMHDNTHLGLNEPPQWSKTLTVDVTSADGTDDTQSMSYMVTVKQIVSKYSKLANITTENCELDPPFNASITEYKCYFWWEKAEWASFTASFSLPGCVGCEIRAPNPDHAKGRHLSMSWRSEVPERWQLPNDVPKRWNASYLFGEYHTIPIQVVSADKYTHTTYNIEFWRSCPWWMATSFTRKVSQYASTLATVMAISSAGNFMALAKQLQFLDMITEIDGIPTIFSDFATSMKAFNIDISGIMPDFGLPTLDDVMNLKDEIVKKIEHESGMSDGRLLIQYCFALQAKGRLEANKILRYHSEDVKGLFERMKAFEAKVAAKAGGKTGVAAATVAAGGGTESVKKSRRLGGDVTAPEMLNASIRRLRGASLGVHGALPLDVSVDEEPSLWRVATAPRRLDADDLGKFGGDDEEEEEEEDPNVHHYEEIWTWTSSDWEDFDERMKDEDVDAHTYHKINCKLNDLLVDGIEGLVIFSKLTVLKRMLHSTTGAFLVYTVALLTTGALYGFFYFFRMRKTQKRYQILEPMEMWIFLLDYCLISFARKASTIAFKESGPVEFFYLRPDRHTVVTASVVGLILYPLGFTVAVLIGVIYYTSSNWLVWDEGTEAWMDQKCLDMRVPLKPKVPPIPPLPALFAMHIRSAVPLLDEEGELMTFGSAKVFLLKHTIVRCKQDMPSPDGKTTFIKGQFGCVVDSTEDMATVNFGGAFYEMESDSLKNLEPRLVKKGKIMVVRQTPANSLGLVPRTRGKIHDIKKDPELMLEIAFGQHAELVTVKGLDLMAIAPENNKKIKAKSKTALRKQIAKDQAERLRQADNGGKTIANNQVIELMELDDLEQARKEQELKSKELEERERERVERHHSTLEHLIFNAQAMAFCKGDDIKQGAVFFDVTLIKSASNDSGLAFEVTLLKVDGTGHTTENLKILADPTQGAAKSFNDDPSNECKLKQGDIIVRINNIHGDGAKMKEVVEKEALLTLRVRRARPAGHEKLAAACPPWLWCDVESLRPKPEEIVGDAKAYVAEKDSGWNKVLPLGDLIATYESVKGRENTERLMPEETFAIMQYIRKFIREEQRLLRYNILQILPRDGYLKPREPMVDSKTHVKPDEEGWVEDPVFGKVPSERWWLSMKEYGFQAKAGDNPWLAQYSGSTYYIENAVGQRLVYMGNARNMWHLFTSLVAPAGLRSGKCEWMSEPEEGWGAWEDKHFQLVLAEGQDEASTQEPKAMIHEPKDPNGVRYANKWQWMMIERWERKWELDEDSEERVRFLCFNIVKADIPMYMSIKKFFIQHYRNRIPNTVSRVDKMEMRKWLWGELMKCMDIKLKLAWCAAQHPKFYKGQTFEDMAEKPFLHTLQDIEHSEPNLSALFPHEHDLDWEGELIAFTLMKFEDLHDAEEEPWWEACDQPIDGEKKVMLDHSMFFRREDDVELQERYNNNDLVPPHGYFTSRSFQQQAEERVGCKRYILMKPDASETPFTIDVQMSQIQTLMRYTDYFKLNVPVSSLELPNKFQWKLVLDEKGKHEWYMYGLDRMLVLFSIVVLSSKQTGKRTCLVFLALRLAAFLSQLHSKYSSLGQEKSQDESAEADYIRVNGPENDEGGFGDMTEETFKRWMLRLGGLAQEGVLVKLVFALVDWHVMVPLLQTLTLTLLFAGLSDSMPDPVVALWCIGISCINMVYMNLATMGSTIRQSWNKVQETWDSTRKTFNQAYTQAMDWLAGDNIFGYAFIGDLVDQGMASTKANAVNLLVPKLGLTFNGKPDVDEGLPHEDQVARRMTKKMAYYVHRKEDADDRRLRSVKDLSRYDKDITPTLGIAMQLEQLMLRQPIPQIMCTVQCVNHCGSKLSKPEHDSFLTLYKPDGWEEEFDHDKEKVHELVNGWQKELTTWMRTHLGAVYSDRTCAAQIRHEMMDLLKAECTQDVHRRVRRVHVGSLRLPRRHVAKGSKSLPNYDDCIATVMVVWETEKVAVHYPTSRCSGYGKMAEIEALPQEFEIELTKRPPGCGIEFDRQEKATQPLKVKEILFGSVAAAYNNSVDAGLQIRLGDSVSVVKIDGVAQNSKDPKVFLGKGQFLISFLREGADDDHANTVELDTRDDGWGWSLRNPSNTREYPELKGISFGGPLQVYNQKQKEDHPDKPRPGPGDIIVQVDDAKDPYYVRSTADDILKDSKREKAKFKIKRAHCGVSMHEGFAVKGQAFETLEVALEEAKKKAVLDSRVAGFCIASVGVVDKNTYSTSFFTEWVLETQENSTVFRVEQEPHIKYHCEIDTAFDALLPLNVNKVRLAVWCQSVDPARKAPFWARCCNWMRGKVTDDTESPWEELVAFSPEIDVFNMTTSTAKKTHLDSFPLYSKFTQSAKYKIEPWGGERKDDDEEEDEFAEYGQSCMKVVRLRMYKYSWMVWRWFCSLFQEQITKDAVALTQGDITFGIIDDPEVNRTSEDDYYRAMMSMKDVLAGESLNLEKLKRHKDRWIDLAKVFGVYGYSRLGEKELVMVKEHLKLLEKLKQDIDNTASTKEKERILLKAGVRRQLAKSEVSGVLVIGTVAAIEFIESPESRECIKEALLETVAEKMGIAVDSPSLSANVFLTFQEDVKTAHSASAEGVRISYTADIGQKPKALAEALKGKRRDGKDDPFWRNIHDKCSDLKTRNRTDFYLEFCEHETHSEMDKAIANMADDLERIQARADRKMKMGINPRAPHELKFRRIGYHIHELTPSGNFEGALLAELWKATKEQREGAKQILHYVCMSDHLKPGKNWKPDPIQPHVCSVLTQEFEDIEQVTLTGGVDPEKRIFREVVFKRELKADGTKEPAILNGRLLFKAVEEDGVDKLDGFPRWSVHEAKIKCSPQEKIGTTQEMTLKEAKAFAATTLQCKGFFYDGPKDLAETDKVQVTFVKEWQLIPTQGKKSDTVSFKKNEVWLYWDGQARWVMSCKKGDPPPYGLKGQNADNFVWVRDTKAMTPDQVTNTWMRWKNRPVDAPPRRDGMTGQWMKDSEIKAFSEQSGSNQRTNQIVKMAEDHDDGNMNDDEEGVCSIIGGMVWDFVGELLSIFHAQGFATVDPSSREALISMNSHRISFTWKDEHIERLAPFRLFLLKDFGSYEAAWTFMTSATEMPRSLGRRNLAMMLYRTSQEIRSQEDVNRKQADTARDCMKLTDYINELQADFDGTITKDEALNRFCGKADAADGIRASDVVDLLGAYGWANGKWRPKADIYSKDPDVIARLFKMMLRDVDRLQKRQGTICDVVVFTAQFVVESTKHFEQHVPEWLDAFGLEMESLEHEMGLTSYDVHFSIELGTPLGSQAGSSKVPERTVQKVLAAVLNCETSTVTVVETTERMIKAYITTTDAELADECKTSSTTQSALEQEFQEKTSKTFTIAKQTVSMFGFADMSVVQEEGKGLEKQVLNFVPSGKVFENIQLQVASIVNVQCHCECKDVASMDPNSMGPRSSNMGARSSNMGARNSNMGARGSQMGKRGSAMRGRNTASSLEEQKATMSATQSGVGAAANFKRNNLKIMKDFLKAGAARYGKPDEEALKRDKADLLKKAKDKKKSGRKTVEKEEDAASKEQAAFETLAAHLVDRLDADRSATINVAELHSLYGKDTDLQQTLVQFALLVEPYEIHELIEQEPLRQMVLQQILETSLLKHLPPIPKKQDDNEQPTYAVKARLDHDLVNEVVLARVTVVVPVGLKANELKKVVQSNMPKIVADASNALHAHEKWNGCLEDTQVTLSLKDNVLLRKADNLLEQFRIFLKAHPIYNKIENMWAELSEDVEISLADFSSALAPRMCKVIDPRLASYDDMTKAQYIFAQLDVQMSGGVTLKELIPSSGKKMKDVDKDLLTFEVPLVQLKEVKLEGHKKKGVEGKQSVRFVLNPQFESSKEWAALRTALNPDWEPSTNESLQVTMVPRYYELWRAVIRESEMMQPQQFILHYDGGYEEHPLIGGVYMRDGQGVQHWVDGRVYAGNFKNHLYEGEGTLYNSIAEWQANTNPVYRGGWSKGKRSGIGKLVWEQEINSEAAGTRRQRNQMVGITKRYEGGFRNDLFHGKGKLEVVKAKTQTLNTKAVTGVSRPGTAPPQQVDPSQLISFDGIFSSDWDETDRLVRVMDPSYHSAYPEFRTAREEGGKPASRAMAQEKSNMDKSTTARPRLDRAMSRVNRGRSSTNYSELRHDASAILDEGSVGDPDLDLDRIKKKDRYVKDSPGYFKFHKYFPVDPRTRVQASGATLPDLAIGAYSLSTFWPRSSEDEDNPGGFDTMHLKEGKARYADGTEYEGEFFEGRPHGRCIRMLQHETVKGQRRKLTEYVGGMRFGMKWGKGTYRIFSYDPATGAPYEAFVVGEVSAEKTSKLMSESVGVIFQTEKHIDKKNPDAVLQHKELKGSTLETWSRQEGKIVAEWGSVVEGIVEGDFLKVKEGMYLPMIIPADKSWMGTKKTKIVVTARAEEKDGVMYEGEWRENKRHGRGRQVVPSHLNDFFGYWTYTGEWFEDQRQGQGEMVYGERGEFLYVGPFEEDVRQGGEVEVGTFADVFAPIVLNDGMGAMNSMASERRSVGPMAKNFGKVYLKDGVADEPLLTGEFDCRSFQSGFAKFTPHSGRWTGPRFEDYEIPGEMTIADAMLQVVTLQGCTGFYVEKANVWDSLPNPFSHINVLTWDEKFKVKFFKSERWLTGKVKADLTEETNFTTFKRSHDYLLVLNGRWHCDMVATGVIPGFSKKQENAWSHLVIPGERKGRYYFGQLRPADGNREGVGTLYDETLLTDDDRKELIRCFERGEVFTSQNCPHPRDWPIKSECFKSFDFDSFIKEFILNSNYTKLDGISFHGQWANNVPHGHGVQHFPGLKKGGGTYLGQFVEGLRQGYGVWVTNDGHWKYRPIDQQRRVPNWDQDKMHGLAIVEDPKVVHENVIFTRGACQMPFTDIGPPQTGFDTTSGVGSFVRMFRSMKHAPLATCTPDASIAKVTGNSKAKRGEHGVDPEETKALEGAGNARGIAAVRKAGRSLTTGNSIASFSNFVDNTIGSQAALLDDEQQREGVAVLREPTDLNMPEEDIIVEGGTGPNAVMNGLYFKLSGTFGIPMYRLVKREGGFLGLRYTYEQRFLFKDPRTNFWIISPKPKGGIVPIAGAAFAQDADAARPGDVTSPWYVWHPASAQMKCDQEEVDRVKHDEKALAELRKNPVDVLTIHSIVGFELIGVPADTNGLEPGLMLRHASEFYGRPVYETESANQVLYYMEDGGKAAQGADASEFLPDDAEGPAKFWRKNGFWALAKQCGLSQKDTGFYAFVNDQAMSPDTIDRTKKWKIRNADGNFVDAELTLEKEGWDRNRDLMDTFEGVRQTYISSTDRGLTENGREFTEAGRTVTGMASRRSRTTTTDAGTEQTPLLR